MHRQRSYGRYRAASSNSWSSQVSRLLPAVSIMKLTRKRPALTAFPGPNGRFPCARSHRVGRKFGRFVDLPSPITDAPSSRRPEFPVPPTGEVAFATPTTECEREVAQRMAHDPSLHVPNGPSATDRTVRRRLTGRPVSPRPDGPSALPERPSAPLSPRRPAPRPAPAAPPAPGSHSPAWPGSG